MLVSCRFSGRSSIQVLTPVLLLVEEEKGKREKGKAIYFSVCDFNCPS